LGHGLAVDLNLRHLVQHTTNNLGLTVGYGYHDVGRSRNLDFAALQAMAISRRIPFSIAPEIGKLLRYKSLERWNPMPA
jgi:hypothetical protein